MDPDQVYEHTVKSLLDGGPKKTASRRAAEKGTAKKGTAKKGTAKKAAEPARTAAKKTTITTGSR
jgi:topoisomerase IA-like protein